MKFALRRFKLSYSFKIIQNNIFNRNIKKTTFSQPHPFKTHSLLTLSCFFVQFHPLVWIELWPKTHIYSVVFSECDNWRKFAVQKKTRTRVQYKCVFSTVSKWFIKRYVIGPNRLTYVNVSCKYLICRIFQLQKRHKLFQGTLRNSDNAPVIIFASYSRGRIIIMEAFNGFWSIMKIYKVFFFMKINAEAENDGSHVGCCYFGSCTRFLGKLRS